LSQKQNNEDNLSPWQKWKKNLGETRPWHLIDPNADRVSEEIEKSRYEICKACPHLIKMTKQCNKCGCFMPGKVKLKKAACPIGKWSQDE
jgi:Family of unknown function (DUF6171)